MAVFQYKRPGGKFCENVWSAMRQSIHHAHCTHDIIAEPEQEFIRIYVLFVLSNTQIEFSLWMKIHYQFKQIAISIFALCVATKWNRLKLIEYWINSFRFLYREKCIFGCIVVGNLEGFFFVCCLFFLLLFLIWTQWFSCYMLLCAQKL